MTLEFSKEELDVITSALYTASKVCGEENDFENQHIMEDMADRIAEIQLKHDSKIHTRTPNYLLRP